MEYAIADRDEDITSARALRQFQEEQKFIEEGLQSQLRAIDAEQDAAIEEGQLFLKIEEARARVRRRDVDEFVDRFQAGNNANALGLDSLLQRTQTVGQAFAQMGRTIASALIQDVVTNGLKKVEQALFDFLEEAQRSGLLKSLLGLIGFGASAATSTAAAPSFADGGAGLFATGAGLLELQHGGVVRRPTIAMIGEGGPEAVVPLNRLRPSGDITVNVMNYSGAQVETEQRRGPNGQQVFEIVIGAVKTAVANGSWDRL